MDKTTIHCLIEAERLQKSWIKNQDIKKIPYYVLTAWFHPIECIGKPLLKSFRAQ